MISALYWTNALSWIFKMLAMLAHWNSLCSYSLVTCAQKQHMPITQCVVWPDNIRTSIYRRFLIIRYHIVDIVRCMGGLKWWLISSILLCLVNIYWCLSMCWSGVPKKPVSRLLGWWFFQLFNSFLLIFLWKKKSQKLQDTIRTGQMTLLKGV